MDKQKQYRLLLGLMIAFYAAYFVFNFLDSHFLWQICIDKNIFLMWIQPQSAGEYPMMGVLLGGLILAGSLCRINGKGLAGSVLFTVNLIAATVVVSPLACIFRGRGLAMAYFIVSLFSLPFTIASVLLMLSSLNLEKKRLMPSKISTACLVIGVLSLVFTFLLTFIDDQSYVIGLSYWQSSDWATNIFAASRRYMADNAFTPPLAMAWPFSRGLLIIAMALGERLVHVTGRGVTMALERLDMLHRQGRITPEQYNQKRINVLSRM